MWNAELDLIVIKEPKSPISEGYRVLRTNIQYSSVDQELKKILVTSSMQSEGKTTTTSNLAVVLAKSGSRVIIIDCDQRRPSIHKKFKLPNSVGLSDYLVKRATKDEVIQKTVINNVDILTVGTIPPNPSELLATKKMESFLCELEKEYDYVILDTPPVGLVTDAQLLSRYVDGVLYVVGSNQVDIEIIQKSKKLLDNVNANIIGVILNKIPLAKNSGYYYAYGEDNYKTKRKSRKR